LGYSIPENLIEEIREGSDIVDVISELVVLKKKGKNFVGLCPFHTERTPSFTVSQENQMFYCFGCGTGGNVYTFLMKYHGLSFVDAVKTLAERAGIQLPAENDISPASKEKSELRKRLLAVNELACSYYRYMLKQPAGVEALRYLKQRQIEESSVDEFNIGWAPAAKDSLCNFLIRRGFSSKEIILAGLGQAGYKGSLTDCFRSRIMFPISDYKGRIIGFGGRVLGDGEPKYLNTGETELFHKGHILYGLYSAIPQIRKSGFAVIVEGYTDVISAFQGGVTNVVASLGTAFTRDQAKLLRRYTEDVVIAYDADAAGTSATLKGMEILSENEFRVRVAPVPEGLDPDSYIKTKGGNAFLELVKGKSLSFVEYRLGQVCKKFDISSVSGRLAAVNEIIPTLVSLKNEVERVEYIKLVSRRLSLSFEAISEEVSKYAGKLQKNGFSRDKIGKNRYTRGRVLTPQMSVFRGPEHALVWTLIQNPGLLGRIEEEIGIDNFSEPFLRDTLYTLKNRLEAGDTIEPLSLIDSVSEEKAKQFISQMAMKEFLPPQDSPHLIEECIGRAKKHIVEQKIIALQEQLASADAQGDIELQRKYVEEINRLFKMKESLPNSGITFLERGE